MSDETLNEAVAAAPDTGVTATSDVADNGQPGDAESQEPKTFTQEDLDKIVAEQKAKIERKVRRELAQAAEAASRPAPQRPDPNDFVDAETYAEALAEHKVEEKLAQREQQQRQTTVEATYAEREEDARTKYDDFERVVYNDDLKITPLMAEAIKSSDIGPDIAYHLGKNPEESARISGLSPIAQAREIGKLEASLSANPVVKKVSSAPAPIKPVGSRSTTPNISTSDPRSAKVMDSDEWIRKRNAEVAARHRTQG